MGLLYDYCNGCGRRIEIGEMAYEIADKTPEDPDLGGLTFCEKCCKAVNTMWWWERRTEEQEDGSI